MKKSNVLVLFTALLLLVLFTASCDPIVNATYTSPTTETTVIKNDFSAKDLQHKGKSVKITHHAQCRMDCRTIDVGEIQEVIDQKQINIYKSKPNPSAGKCPSYAYEGRTKRDQQRLRIIVGECEDRPIIITVIDLENDYQCSCK